MHAILCVALLTLKPPGHQSGTSSGVCMPALSQLDPEDAAMSTDKAASRATNTSPPSMKRRRVGRRNAAGE